MMAPLKNGDDMWYRKKHDIILKQKPELYTAQTNNELISNIKYRGRQVI